MAASIPITISMLIATDIPDISFGKFPVRRQDVSRFHVLVGAGHRSNDFRKAFTFCLFFSAFSRWVSQRENVFWLLQMLFRKGFDARSCRERRLGVLESFPRNLDG